MSNPPSGSNVVSLDDYRRAREAANLQRARGSAASRQTAPVSPLAAAAWVYWVPVWVW